MSEEHAYSQPLKQATEKPKVSVIMNCLNSEQYLRQAIDSVYAQSYTDWEIIFWDNASTDSSAVIAKSYDSKLRYYRGTKTIPLGAARNKALEQARGELIAFLDCDDLWLPEKLEKQIPCFDNPRVGLVHSNFYILDDETGKERIQFKRKTPSSGHVFRERLVNYGINMQTVMIRNSAENRFDPDLTLSEEYVLFMKILFQWEARYIHEPLAVYRVHSGMHSKSFTHRYPYEMELALERFDTELDGFKSDYSRERCYLMFKVAYWRARAEMASGNRFKALNSLVKAKGFWRMKISLIVLAVAGPTIWRFVHAITKHYNSLR